MEKANSGQYEFNESENVIVSNLASKMAFVGSFSVVFGIVIAICGVAVFRFDNSLRGVGAGYFVQGAISLLIGYWTRAAAVAFKRIVETKGNDIGNLLRALGGLGRIYALQRLVYIVGLALFLLAIAIAIFTLPQPTPAP